MPKTGANMLFFVKRICIFEATGADRVGQSAGSSTLNPVSLKKIENHPSLPECTIVGGL